MFTDYKKKEIQTDRLKISYLEAGDSTKETLVLIHGNTSSSVFFIPAIEALKDHFHIFAPDLRGYGHTERKPIDATTGMGMWAEDIRSFIETLNLKNYHLIGWSMGGGIAIEYTLNHATEVKSLGLINPLSPFGFSGTKGAEGKINNPSHSGTGAGLVNPSFIKSLEEKSRDLSDPFSAPNVLKGLFAKDYVFDKDLETLFVDGMFDMALGEDYYPGDAVPTAEWPNMGPGKKGIINTMSPKYVNLNSLIHLKEKPPIIWFRGVHDTIVSDASLSDIGQLGKLGFIPGWPGDEVYPPQPMVTQTRRLLSQYEKEGGTIKEVVFDESGHSPQIEEPKKFVSEYLNFLGSI